MAGFGKQGTDALVLLGSVVAGNWVAERFVLKGDKDDPTGFIVVSDGFGMDDIARGAVIVAIAMLAGQLFR